MSQEYYSDRVQGPRPRAVEDIPLGAWGGIVSILDSAVGAGLFAEDFPRVCEDNGRPVGCDEQSFFLALRADIPEFEKWPTARTVPDVLSVLDLIEFLQRHASEPIRRDFHSFFSHHHLDFDRGAGRQRLQDQVNRVLARNGIAFELSVNGQVRRLGPSVLGEQLRHRLPPTGDWQLDDLLERARQKFLDPDPAVQREAVDHAWDAFERVKTVLDPDKKRGAADLAATVGTGAAEVALIEDEMHALTRIGNQFRIRHHETTAIEPTKTLLDYLFARMFAFLVCAHPTIVAVGTQAARSSSH